MTKPREVIEGPQYQGEDEEIVYTIDISEWGSSPSGVTVKVYDEDGADVTTTVTSGSSSTTTTTITLPTIKSLTAGTQYRVEIKFTAGGQVLEAYFVIIAED